MSFNNSRAQGVMGLAALPLNELMSARTVGELATRRGVAEVPQYRRTHAQNCVCVQGMAGCSCCPSGTIGAAAHASRISHGLAMAGLGALNLVGVAMSARVLFSLSIDALGHLRPMQAWAKARVQERVLDIAHVNATGTTGGRLPGLRALCDGDRAAWALWGRYVAASINVQIFNLLVPGVLQLAASTTGVLAAVGAGTTWASTLAVASAALFGAYALAMSAHAVYARRGWAAATPPGTPGPAELTAAWAGHWAAARSHLGLTACAWASSAAAATLGALWLVGALVHPLAGPCVLGLGLGSAAWAMWQNSHTRYALHLPLGLHTAAPNVGTPVQRARAHAHLSRQDAAIKAAVAALNADTGVLARLRYAIERAWAPQCGPRANRVLPARVQAVATASSGAAARKRQRYLRTQLEALRAFCIEELALWQTQSDEHAQRLQMAQSPLGDPLDDGAKIEAMRDTFLVDAEQRKCDADERVRAWKQLEVYLQRLYVTCTQSDAESVCAALDADDHWTRARYLILLLTGTLGDALNDNFIEAHGEGGGWLSYLPPPRAWAIPNVHVLPGQHEAVWTAMRPQLDAAFVHAMFNWRRLEADVDYILALQCLDEAGSKFERGADAVPSLTAAQAASCCR